MSMAGGNGARNSRGAGGAIIGINVTPLVDITLVLLVIFMVTAKIIVSHVALAVDLPKAATGNETQELFSVVIPASGAGQVNGALLAHDDDLMPLARAAQAANKDLRAVIKADGEVPHRRVMHVLDLLRRAGVTKVGFGVEPVPAPASEGR
jgi:biopolymer transport protein ExbD